MRQVLALDVGRSSVKAAILDVESGSSVGAIACIAYDLARPTPEAAEVPAERLWSAVTSAACQAMRGVDTVDGIGLSCLAPGLVLLDAMDQPLAPIRMPLDRRARPAARQVWAAAGEEFLATTGNRPLHGGISAVCYRQVLSDTPYLIRKVHRYLHLNSWLGLRLTGETAIDPANASLTGLYNTLTDQKWSPRWCDFFNVEPSWLPPIASATTTLGTVRPTVAVELGVPPGVPVKLGTTDVASTVLAAGMQPGDLLHVGGATQLLATIVTRPMADPRRMIQQLGVGDEYLHLTFNPVGSAALDWLHQLCYRDQTREEFLGATIEAALRHETRVGLEPPHLGGEELEIEAHRASFRDLTLDTERLDLLAALLREMRRQHQRAVEMLEQPGPVHRVFLSEGDPAMMRRVLPGYAGTTIFPLEEGSLRGVAALFAVSHPS